MYREIKHIVDNTKNRADKRKNRSLKYNIYIVLLTILIGLMLIDIASADIYHVSSNGNDDNPGTKSQPFKTIQRGISASSNGDTVIVLPGTYYQTGKISISKSINVIGSGRNTAIIDGSNTTFTDGALVEITGNGVLFQGFTVQNILYISGMKDSESRGAILIKSDNNIIERNYIKNIYNQGIALWGPWASSSHVTNNIIRYNELYDISKGVSNATCSDLHVQEALSIVQADTFEVYYNYIHKAGYSSGGGNVMCGAEGLDIYENVLNGKIHHNYIYDTRSVGLYVDEALNVDIYQNIVENTYGWNGPPTKGSGIGLAAERGGTDQRIYIHDNIVYNNYRGTYICLATSSGGDIKDITIDSNIYYTNNYDIRARDCRATYSNILIENNYVNTTSVDSAISGKVTLSGNDKNLKDIANQFYATYPILKSDILARSNFWKGYFVWK